MNNMTDSELMKSTRSALNLTQSEMAKLLGYGYQKDISRIETGDQKMSNQTKAHLLTLIKQDQNAK